MSEEIETLVSELETAAARLRTGELDGEEAAELVERCAELAARIGTGLEGAARASVEGEPPGQESLL